MCACKFGRVLRLFWDWGPTLVAHCYLLPINNLPLACESGDYHGVILCCVLIALLGDKSTDHKKLFKVFLSFTLSFPNLLENPPKGDSIQPFLLKWDILFYLLCGLLRRSSCLPQACLAPPLCLNEFWSASWVVLQKVHGDLRLLKKNGWNRHIFKVHRPP